MQFDARRATTSGATKPHHTQPRRTDGRTKRGCNRRGDARRSGRERGGGATVCLLSKQRAAAAGGERGTEQMEVETDKELGLVFRGWGTGTGQAQGERHNLDGRWTCPGGLYASPLLSLVPHRLDSGRLISVHVHIAACQSKVGQQIDVSFFFFLGKKRDLDDHWSCSQLVGAVCPGFRPLCVHHPRAQNMPGAWDGQQSRHVSVPTKMPARAQFGFPPSPSPSALPARTQPSKGHAGGKRGSSLFAD